MQSKTFRLFISSTFSDFNQERRLLQTYVFPEIKKYCRELGKGYTFQPIDLRWGVSNEAQLDQKALELCIEEVQSSKSQPHPNFLIMASNRYGWVPLPYAIEQKEFEAIKKNVEDTTLLDTWYQLDNNQLPASYIIQKRSGEYEAYDSWVKVENSLREILQEAVEKTPLSNVQKEKYFTSATEAEVIEGIFGYKTITSFQEALTHKASNYPLLDSEHLYGYIRDVKSVEDENFNRMFIDEDVTQADQFKDELRGAIKKENLLNVEANLTKLSRDKKNGSLHYAYDAIQNEQDSQFVTTMIAFLKRSIDSYEVEEATTPQEIEEYEQERFKEDKLKLFIGREEPLKAIKDYINGDNNQPLVIYGPSGMGKSSLMAKAIDETKKEKVYRFVGSTSTLTSSEQLLISILKTFGIEEQVRQIKDEKTGQEKPELIKEFYLRGHDHLKNISDEKVIFIDAVDQLVNKDEFIWLPSKLPSNLKIIISALEDDAYPEDTKYLTALKKKTSNLYKLGKFEESETLIRSILKQYDRSITDTQLAYLQTIYKDINTPLYLTIAAQEIRHWSSEDKTIDVDTHGKKLAATQKGIIAEYIENLTKLYHHDEELVKRVLSYLYLTEGLSEAELLELLSTDEVFVKKMAPSTYHNNVTKELPSVIWARLHTQLQEFIKLEEKDGQETMSFFHREFNDTISHQKDMQGTHEELITLVYKLIEKYQDDPFDNNRWGDFYIEIVKNYYIEYEFSYDYNVNTKFKEYAEAILGVENETYKYSITTSEVRFKKIHTNNSKSEISFNLFNYYPISKLYKNNPDVYELANNYRISLNNLAGSYVKNGQTQKAIDLYEEALSITKEYYSDNPDRWAEKYTISLSKLADSYRRTGQTEKSIALFEEALSILKERYRNDPDRWAYMYTASLSNLADSYKWTEQTVKAIIRSEEALSISQECYNNDPDRWAENYTKRLRILAGLYNRTDQTEKSISLYEKAIALDAEALSILKERYSNDPDRWVEDYIISLNNLAYSYLRTHEIKKAIDFYEEASIILKEHYCNDPDRWVEDYTISLNNLAYSYKGIYETEKAIAIEEEALSISKERYSNDPDIWADGYASSLNNLANSYVKIDQTEKSIALFEVALNILKERYSNDPDRWAEKYTICLSNVADSYKKTDQIEKAITFNAEALSILKERYHNDRKRWAEKYMSRLSNLVDLYKRTDQTEKAIAIDVEYLNFLKERYSDDPDRWADDYTIRLNILINSYKNNGQIEKAIAIEEEDLSILKKERYSNPERWAEKYTTRLRSLAGSYADINQTEKSIAIEEEALSILKKEHYYGDSDRWVDGYTTSLINLIALYKDIDQTEKSIALFEETLSILEELKEGYSNDPGRWVDGYTACISNLADSYMNNGQIEKAIDLYEEAFSIRKEMYCKDPDRWVNGYTTSLTNLIASYKNNGQTKEEIELYEEALSITQALYSNDPERWVNDYTTRLNILVAAYKNNGNIEKTILLYEEALSITQALYSNDPERWADYYSTTLNNLGVTYYNNGQIEQSIPIYEEALSIRKGLYSEDPDKWAEKYTEILNNLANSYSKSGEAKEAIELLEEALSIKKSFYGKDPERWAEEYTESLIDLATLFHNLNQAEAIALYKEALSIRKVLYSNNPERWAEEYAESLKHLGASYAALQEEYEKAEPLLIKSLEIKERIFAEAHYDTLDNLHWIADISMKLNKYKEANYYSEKYFKTIDFNNYIDDITMFILLFIKWYHMVYKEQNTTKIEELNEFAKNTIVFYKEKLDTQYNETIQRLYDGYSQVAKTEIAIERIRLFQKIFIDENHDCDIK